MDEMSVLREHLKDVIEQLKEAHRAHQRLSHDERLSPEVREGVIAAFAKVNWSVAGITVGPVE